MKKPAPLVTNPRGFLGPPLNPTTHKEKKGGEGEKQIKPGALGEARAGSALESIP
jgi:hypothetical protein